MDWRDWRDVSRLDYYETLGVRAHATPDEIAQAYRRLAREVHPDTHPEDAFAEERFKRLGEAHDVLSDPARRRLYDRVRERSGGGDERNHSGHQTRGNRPPGPRRGRDVVVTVTLSPGETMYGGTLSVAVPGRGEVQIAVPPPVRAGARFRLPGLGKSGQAGGPPGDVVIVLRIPPPPVLRSWWPWWS